VTQLQLSWKKQASFNYRRPSAKVRRLFTIYVASFAFCPWTAALFWVLTPIRGVLYTRRRRHEQQNECCHPLTESLQIWVTSPLSSQATLWCHVLRLNVLIRTVRNCYQKCDLVSFIVGLCSVLFVFIACTLCVSVCFATSCLLINKLVNKLRAPVVRRPVSATVPRTHSLSPELTPLSPNVTLLFPSRTLQSPETPLNWGSVEWRRETTGKQQLT